MAEGELIHIGDGGHEVQPVSIEENLDLAERAATALRERVFAKVPPVKIQGKQYPLVEHWQTIASFFGVVARVVETEHVVFGDAIGWKAVAEAVRVSDGSVLSRAEAMCLSDEPKWASRPQHQVIAMAQTRAISRCLRNVFSRIMVLAGVEASPAEDLMVDDEAPGRRRAQVIQADSPGVITEKQQKFLFARAREAGRSNDEIRQMLSEFGYSSSAEIKKADFEKILERLSG